MHLYEIRGLNFKILKLFVETSEPNGMKNLAIQNRVLQRDRVLQRRVLERDYCIWYVYAGSRDIEQWSRAYSGKQGYLTPDVNFQK